MKKIIRGIVPGVIRRISKRELLSLTTNLFFSKQYNRHNQLSNNLLVLNVMAVFRQTALSYSKIL